MLEFDNRSARAGHIRISVRCKWSRPSRSSRPGNSGKAVPALEYSEGARIAPEALRSAGASRGSLSIRTYWSRELNMERRLVVYLPPEYDSDPRRKFPVLYLRHGNGATEDDWIVLGPAGTILENLLAAKKAVPMIFVMPNGYPSTMAPGGTPEGIDATSRELVREIVPLIEKNYRAMTGPENRALAGLSMGGRQSLVGGLKNLDTFAWVAAFSAQRDFKVEVPGFLENPTVANKKLKLLFLSCGTEDLRYPGNLAMVDALKQSGIRHEFFSTPGEHEWSVWRTSLIELLPKLFRPK
jgi:enterochelin esterase-like enzyme